MKTKIRPSYSLMLLIVSALLLLPHLQMLPVNIMEARNFITAREMAVDGHWIMTTLNGLPRYEKPPLPTWLTAFSGWFFGFKSLTAMRLPVTLITFLLIGAAYRLSQQIGLSKRQSFHNALILISSFYIFFAGRDNQWDMYCHSFMMLTLVSLWQFMTGKGNLYLLAILTGLLLGCSLLSKGPVSVYSLLLPFFIAYTLVYKFSLISWKRYLFPVLVLLLSALLIGGSWWMYVRHMDPETFLNVTGSEMSRWTNYNIRPFYYYWSFFTQTGIWTIPAFVALLYPMMKKKVTNLNAYQFTLIWTLASFLLLSIVPEKKTRYLLPVLIPMALNTGFYIEYLWHNFKFLASKKEKWIPFIGFGILGVIAIAFPALQLFFIKNIRYELAAWLILSSFFLFTLGIFLLRSLVTYNFKHLFYGSIALQIAVIVFGFPLAKSLLYNPNYQDTKPVKQLIGETNIPIYAFTNLSPEIIWDYGKPIPVVTEKSSLMVPFGILVEKKDSAILWQRFGKYKIQKKEHVNILAGQKPPGPEGSRLYADFYLITP